MNNPQSVDNPALPSRPRHAFTVVLVVALNYVLQGVLLFALIPHFRGVYHNLVVPSAHALPPLSRIVFQASTLALRYKFLAVIILLAFAVSHSRLYFRPDKNARFWVVLLLVFWLFVVMLEVLALFLPLVADIHALPHH